MTITVINYRNIMKMRYFNYNVSNFVRNFYKRIKIRLNCDKYNLSPSLCVGG
jgi:hypothetical protein